jgi:DNA (cytosine-5)-methyltransferase 1
MNAIDLFSGPGGLALGLKRAGYHVIANVEINRDAMDTYTSHDLGATHFNVDARSLSFKNYRGSVDLVAGGPPCQPFSIGGNRQANLDDRDMIPEFIRCITETRPESFLMENVPGLLLKQSRPYFDSILLSMITAGYHVNWAVLNAADYGVPQKRKRLFVIGARCKQLRFLPPSHGEGTKLTHISGLEILGNQPFGEPPNCKVNFAKNPDLRPSPYAGHIYNGGGRPLDPDGPCHTILASSGGNKTHWIDTQNIATEYHAHLVGGGTPREGAVPGARRLSVEECAMIQTFPLDFKFSGKRSSQYTQVGDAVPPDLAFLVAQSIYKQLNEKSDTLQFLEPRLEALSIQYELSL